MSLSRTIAATALTALAALAALPTDAAAAAPPAGRATQQTVTPAAAAAAILVNAPKYSCTINPASPPTGQDFQVTQYSLKLVSGTAPANKKIKVALGIQANGPALPESCTSGLKNGSLTASQIIVAPPVMDPNYIWVCNATQSSETCDPPPAIPR